MTRATLLALTLATFAFVSLPACSSDDGDDVKVQRGTVAARGSCQTSNDCAEPSAICVSGQNVCSDKLGADAFSIECDKDTVEKCPGFACLVISANVQKKTGICSMTCQTDADCGDGAGCASLGQTKGCLKTCTGSADCANGFVCVSDPSNASRKACLVEPSAS